MRIEAKVEYDINCFANRMSYGALNEIKQLNPKIGFVGRPNKALANLEFKRPIWSQIGVEPDGRKREEERRKRKKRRGRRRAKPKRYGCLDFGMETTLSMDFVWIT